MAHREAHRSGVSGWLRAAVLGANDGIVSIASLVLGVAAADAGGDGVLTAGVAGLVGGALSMAAGEYVSVSSQADTEHADLEREKAELAGDVEFETRELTRIYQRRGLDQDLAQQVAVQLMEHDALGAHARDELGITDTRKPRPLQAGLASAATFAIGALLPLLADVGAWRAHRAVGDGGLTAGADRPRHPVRAGRRRPHMGGHRAHRVLGRAGDGPDRRRRGGSARWCRTEPCSGFMRRFPEQGSVLQPGLVQHRFRLLRYIECKAATRHTGDWP